MRSIRTQALLLRTVPYGDSDLIVTLLTQAAGSVGARFRAGRRSTKRAGGGVEPFHTLDVTLEDRGRDLFTMKASSIAVVRSQLTASLEAMDAGGTALRWARFLLPARHPEPAAWRTLTALLDRLDVEPSGHAGLLAMAGFHLLASVGYALELSACVICGRPCPPRAPAFVDARRGGVVCSACGGMGRRLGARVRELAVRAQRGDGAERGDDARWLAVPSWVVAEDVKLLLAVLGDAMAAHAGLPPH